MSKNWKWFLPGYVFALPGTIVGLLLAAFYYHPSDWRFVDGCIECIPRRTIIGGKWVGAQTFGNVIFYRDERMRDHYPLRVHERCHVVQAMLLTWPLFMVLYGGHFLSRFVYLVAKNGLMTDNTETWKVAYREIWFEIQAYSRQADFSAGKREESWGTK